MQFFFSHHYRDPSALFSFLPLIPLRGSRGNLGSIHWFYSLWGSTGRQSKTLLPPMNTHVFISSKPPCYVPIKRAAVPIKVKRGKLKPSAATRCLSWSAPRQGKHARRDAACYLQRLCEFNRLDGSRRESAIRERQRPIRMVTTLHPDSPIATDGFSS